MKKANVEILISTFNGEKYLKEQLNSCLAQEGNFNIKITVRDDGSTDETCHILKQYEEEFHINVIYGQNIGLNASMMELIKLSEEHFDYFAFCDQDDVWENFKIEEAVKCLCEIDKADKVAAHSSGDSQSPLEICFLANKKTPLLWSCMEELTDENLNSYSLMPYPKYLGNFYNAVIQNKTAGHTQVFNKTLRDMYMHYPPDKMYVYDWVLYMLACALGEVYFCDKPCGKYRQHGKNTIGYELGPIAQIPRRLKRLLNGDFRHITTQMAYFYETYGNKIKEEHKSEMERFLNSRKNIFTRVYYALTTKIKRNTSFESLQFRVLYILGVFNC